MQLIAQLVLNPNELRIGQCVSNWNAQLWYQTIQRCSFLHQLSVTKCSLFPLLNSFWTRCIFHINALANFHKVVKKIGSYRITIAIQIPNFKRAYTSGQEYNTCSKHSTPLFTFNNNNNNYNISTFQHNSNTVDQPFNLSLQMVQSRVNYLLKCKTTSKWYTVHDVIIYHTYSFYVLWPVPFGKGKNKNNKCHLRNITLVLFHG